MQTTRQPLLFALTFTLAICVALYLTSRIDLAFSSDLETFSGPRAYPAMILGAMLVFNVITVLQSGFARQDAAPDPARTGLPRTGHAMALFAVLVGFCFVFEPVGYLLTMIPLLILVAWLNGARNWPVTILVSVVLALTCLVIFRYALDTVLPEGLLGIDAVF